MKRTEVKQVINSKYPGPTPRSLESPSPGSSPGPDLSSSPGPGPGPQVCEVFHRAVELIGRRWTGAVIQVMLSGAARFSEIRAAIPGISDRLLAERLKELEEELVLSREVEDGRPPQVFYHLTEKGRALSPVIDSISQWAHSWSENRG